MSLNASLAPVPEADVLQGHPIPFDILDENGHLLLQKGSVLTSRRQVEMVLSRGFFQRKQNGKLACAELFRRLRKVGNQLSALDEPIATRARPKPLKRKLLKLVEDITELSALDWEIRIGSIYLDNQFSGDSLHRVMVAIACARVSKAVGMPTKERHSLTAGALTHDMEVFQRSEHRKVEGRVGADCGIELLYDLGVYDAIWESIISDRYLVSMRQANRRGVSADLPVYLQIMVMADAFDTLLRCSQTHERLELLRVLSHLHAACIGESNFGVMELLLKEYGYCSTDLVRPRSRVIGAYFRSRGTVQKHLPSNVDARAQAGYSLYQQGQQNH